MEYLDQATALNGLKKDAVSGKGALNNQITSLIFQELEKQGIPSHFIKILSKHEQLVCEVEMIPLEIVVRNTAAGSFSKRLGIAEGEQLPFPIIEFYYKEDRLDDPFINEDHIRYLGIATLEESCSNQNACSTNQHRIVPNSLRKLRSTWSTLKLKSEK